MNKKRKCFTPPAYPRADSVASRICVHAREHFCDVVSNISLAHEANLWHNKGMAYTEVTTQSWGSRLGQALKGILTGFVLMIGAGVLLFLNEGRAVKTREALYEAEEKVVCVESNAAIDNEMNNRLVHMSGKATTEEQLQDSTFGISLPAISLARHVEYYQWVEHSSSHEEKQMGGSTRTVTTYTYSKEWCSEPQDSGSFREAGHNNVVHCTMPEDTLYASQVRFGAFRLSEGQIESIGNSRQLELKDRRFCKTPGCRYYVNGNVLTITKDYRPQPVQTGLESNSQAGQPEQAEQPVPAEQTAPAEQNEALEQPEQGAPAPSIGDVRISWTYIEPEQTLSLIAVQAGDTFTSYRASNGRRVQLLNMGEKMPDEMFDHAHSQNTLMLWLLRFGGWLLMFIGLRCATAIFGVLGDVVPFIGTIVDAGMGILCFLLSAVISLVIIAIAWLWYRPILSLCLLAAAAGGIYLLIKRRKKADTPNVPAAGSEA